MPLPRETRKGQQLSFHPVAKGAGVKSYTRSNWDFRSAVRWWLISTRVKSGLDRRLCSTMSAFF